LDSKICSRRLIRPVSCKYLQQFHITIWALENRKVFKFEKLISRMKKGFVVIVLALFLGLSLASAVDSSTSFEEIIKKLTYNAEEYETGNYNYVQFLLYSSAVNNELNSLLGNSKGGLVKPDQLEKVLGKPTDTTKWVYSQGVDHDIKVENPLPFWEKIVFDGEKIQIKLNSYPNLVTKSKLGPDSLNAQNLEDFQYGNGLYLLYWINFYVQFKEQNKEELNIEKRIGEIKVLAEDFRDNPSNENAEKLAEESVSSEKAFESYYKENPSDCNDLMNSLFGSENKRETQKVYAAEVVFYEGGDFDAFARVEMCDDCQWNWINMNIWLKGRSRDYKEPDIYKNEEVDREKYRKLSSDELMSETKTLFGEIKSSFESRDFQKAANEMRNIRAVTDVWNEKANDVDKEIRVKYELDWNKMTQEEAQACHDSYCWLENEQKMRRVAEDIRKANYQLRKAFYEELFAGYEKDESYYERDEWEMKLIEDFVESGREACDNGKDDNNNGQIDCTDEQCGGKICGKIAVDKEQCINECKTKCTSQTNCETQENQENENSVENEASESETDEDETAETNEPDENLENIAFTEAECSNVVDESCVSECSLQCKDEAEMYCIAGTCQVKEMIVEVEAIVCGNHVCEDGEMNNCLEDCSVCKDYGAMECDGKLVYSGKDESGCPLEPVCVSNTCNVNEDCTFLCGEGACIEGSCQITNLVGCEESECTDGDKKSEKCQSGEELYTEICVNGLWKETGVKCEVPQEVETEEGVEEVEAGSQCTVKGDCGNENDVCSNGECVTLPEKEIVEIAANEEILEEEDVDKENDKVNDETEKEIDLVPGVPGLSPEEEQSQEQQEQGGVTGNVVSSFFKGIVGRVITGFAEEGVEGGESGGESGGGGGGESGENGRTTEEGTTEGGQPETSQTEQTPEYSPDNNEDENDDEDRRREEDEKRREENKQRCEDNCDRECYDRKIMPCVDKCVRESCGENLECDLDQEKEKCEEGCRSEVDFDGCKDDCVGNCMEGKQTQKEPNKDDQKKEYKGAFVVGGSCMKESETKKQGFIYFGGWGKPFDRIQEIKNSYYNNGQSDWCKVELENLKKQRAEFEAAFDEKFVKWFFDDYLASSAEEWDQHVSCIYELYWRDVDLSREMAFKLECAGENQLPEFNLINVAYETKYGKFEFWEEVEMGDPNANENDNKDENSNQNKNKKVQMISPYMRIGLFPPKEVMESMFKKTMEKRKFGGNDGNNGLPDKEKEKLKSDEQLMDWIREMSSEYGGSYDVVVQFEDPQTEELILNLYVQIDEENILTVTPMPYAEVPQEDARVVLDFNKLYDLIETGEKNNGDKLVSPPWNKKPETGVFRGMKDGVQMFLKFNSFLNSAEYYPKSSEREMKMVMNRFLRQMLKGGDNSEGGEGGEGESENGEGKEGENNNLPSGWDDKDTLTGEVIAVK
jgi:hypothetical protein